MTTTPTFESIAKSARIVKLPPKSQYKPLPCESGASEYFDYEAAGVKNLLERFPVLNMSFMETTYFDSKLKAELPEFAVINVAKGEIESHLPTESISVNDKLNPRLKSFFGVKKSPISMGEHIACFIFASVVAGVIYMIAKSSNLDLPYYVSMGIGAASMGFAYFLSINDKKERIIINYSYKFQGQIPEDVRAIYHAEKSNFDSIHLVCDAKNRWVAEERPLPPPNPDPLLVGVKKLASGKDLVFLLAKFDLTPAEQYVTDEFAI